MSEWIHNIKLDNIDRYNFTYRNMHFSLKDNMLDWLTKAKEPLDSHT